MWWADDYFNRRINDKNGRVWLFKVWMGHIEGILYQKIFFWDSEKEVTGIVEFKDDQCIHLKRIKDRIQKLVKEKPYRDKFLCPLKFPLENYY